MNGNLALMMYLLLLTVPLFYFARKSGYGLLNIRYISPSLAMLVAVILSALPAYIYSGQGVFQSLISSKTALCYLTLPALLIVKPSYNECKTALYAFTVLLAILFVAESFLNINIIAWTQEEIERFQRIADRTGDKVRLPDGIHFVAIAFIFSLYDLVKNNSLKSLFVSGLLIILLFLAQNRTTLFACALLFVAALFKLPRKRRTAVIKVSVILFGFLFLAVTFKYWLALIEETFSQLGNPEYNRNLSYAYFLGPAVKGLTSAVLGNGFISAHSSTLMQDLMETGIYNSDVGIVGLWNQFGLIPVIVIVVSCIIGLSKKMPQIVKNNSIFILLCLPTTAYFFQMSKIVWLCFYLYLLSVYDSMIRKDVGKVD